MKTKVLGVALAVGLFGGVGFAAAHGTHYWTDEQIRYIRHDCQMVQGSYTWSAADPGDDPFLVNVRFEVACKGHIPIE